jgi:hypothetical protein
MWTWTRPKSLQSGDWTPDLEPRLREQSLDAVDDPYALIDIANFSRPLLLADVWYLHFPSVHKALRLLVWLQTALRVPVMASSPWKQT